MRYLLLFCLLLMPLAAQTPEAETSDPGIRNNALWMEELDKEGDHSADFGNELIQLALSLGIILVVLLILSWFVKRFLNTRVEQVNLSSNIKVLEKRYLNPKAMIYLVAIGNKQIIVGESPQGLVNLGEIRGNTSEFERVMSEPLKS